MKAVILLGAILISESINPDCVSANSAILSIAMVIFISLDIVELYVKKKGE